MVHLDARVAAVHLTDTGMRYFRWRMALGVALLLTCLALLIVVLCLPMPAGASDA